MSADTDSHIYAEMVKVLDSLFANTFDERLIKYEDSNGWVNIHDIATMISYGPVLAFEVIPPYIRHAMRTNFSQYVEMDQHEGSLRRKAIGTQIKEKIHYWFSDKNWSRDLYLQQTADDNCGMVPVRSLVYFPSMLQSLETEYPGKSIAYYMDILCQALGDSDEVEVIPCDEPYICRLCLPERVRRKIESLFHSQNQVLHELISESPDGYVPLSQILSFSTISEVVKPQVAPVALALKLSTVVEVSPDGQSVRKRIRDAVDTQRDEEGAAEEATEMVHVPVLSHIHAAVPAGKVGFLSAPFRGNSPFEFSVIQFNMLAQFLCTEEWYRYCNKEYLRWNYRRKLFEEGLLRVDADIIGLEEVQGTTFQEPNEFSDHAVYIRNLVRKKGYGMLYCMKTKADGTQNLKSMGNALLFKESVFELLDYQEVKFAVDLQVHCGQDLAVRNRYLSEQQVAVLGKLRHLATGNVIVAAVTHISCKFSQPDIQIAQVAVLLQSLEAYATPHSFTGSNSRLPVILCGDFNSTPDSSVYKLLSTGTLSRANPDIFPSDGDNVWPILKHGSLLETSQRKIVLASAYAKVCGTDPVTTNVKPPFSGCLDYIWFYGLEPFEVLPIGSKEELEREAGLPNSKNPSDHVPIGAKFRFSSSNGVK